MLDTRYPTQTQISGGSKLRWPDCRQRDELACVRERQGTARSVGSRRTRPRRSARAAGRRAELSPARGQREGRGKQTKRASNPRAAAHQRAPCHDDPHMTAHHGQHPDLRLLIAFLLFCFRSLPPHRSPSSVPRPFPCLLRLDPPTPAPLPACAALPDLSGWSRKGGPARSGGPPFLESTGGTGLFGRRRVGARVPLGTDL